MLCQATCNLFSPNPFILQSFPSGYIALSFFFIEPQYEPTIIFICSFQYKQPTPADVPTLSGKETNDKIRYAHEQSGSHATNTLILKFARKLVSGIFRPTTSWVWWTWKIEGNSMSVGCSPRVGALRASGFGHVHSANRSSSVMSCTALACRHRPSRRLKPLPHLGQTYARPFEWLRLCLLKFDESLKVLPHLLHLNRRSLVCLLRICVAGNSMCKIKSSGK